MLPSNLWNIWTKSKNVGHSDTGVSTFVCLTQKWIWFERKKNTNLTKNRELMSNHQLQKICTRKICLIKYFRKFGRNSGNYLDTFKKIPAWFPSLQTDPSAAFCTPTKVIYHSFLYLRPETQEPFHFLGVIVAFLSRRHTPSVCTRWACLLVTTHYPAIMPTFPVIRKKLFRISIPKF